MAIRIFDIDNWREIGATLARNKTRTFLTAFGIFWGTAMLAMLWGGAGGLQQMVMRQMAGLATNTAGIFPTATTMPYRGYNSGMRWSLTDEDLITIRSIAPYIEYSTAVDFRNGRVVYNSKGSTPNSILGVEPQYHQVQIPVLEAGRLLTDSDTRNHAKVVLLGARIASDLFGNKDDAIGQYVSIGGIYFHVVGVVSQLGEASIQGPLEDNVVMPITTLNGAFPQSPAAHHIFLFTVEAGHRPAEVIPYVRRAVSANHPIHPADEGAMQVFDISEIFEQASYIFLGISLLAMFVGGGTLIAGIIGVANIMWIIVKERTNEIGIRRAIGAKPRDIIIQVLCEGFLLTIVAGLAGIAFAVAVLAIADKALYDPELGSAGFQLAFSQAIAVMLMFLVLGTVAGLIPAIKAMKIKPIEAINAK